MSDTITTPRKRRPASRPDGARLFEIASSQAGYFTSAQGRDCGFSWALLSHHAKSGRFVRVRRGLYRLREYPSSPREHVLAAWLAAGNDAVVSHESALELLELSDVIPDAVHLTVPRSRRNLPSLNGARIHTTARPMPRSDLVTRGGIVVTSAARSILDAADAGVAPEQVEKAVVQAIDAGVASGQQLRRGAQGADSSDGQADGARPTRGKAMKHETSGAFRAALEQRLPNLGRKTGVPLLRLRKLVVFDRLLARLIAVSPSRCTAV